MSTWVPGLLWYLHVVGLTWLQVSMYSRPIARIDWSAP